MKNIKRIVKVILSMSLIMSQITACSIVDSRVDWKDKNELVFGTTFSTKSLDPANSYCGWYLVRYGIGETLFKLNDDMEVVPWLAEDYEIIDSKTINIKIKDNINFQNGKKLTGEAVKKSIDRTLKLNARAKVTSKIEEILANGQNLTIKTTESNPTLINDLCDPFAAIIDVDSEQSIDVNPIGTGPYKVGKFNQNKESYFVKNDSYWNGKVKLDKIKVIPISDADILAMALQSGEIDVAQGLSYSMVEQFEKDSNYKISSTDTSRAIVMYFNNKNTILKDLNVKKAINSIIDKEAYCKWILKNQGTVGIGAFPTSTNYALQHSDLNYEKKDAIELLKASGYTDSDNDGILEKDGKKLTLRLVTYSSRVELPSIAQVIQNDLKNIGIDVSIDINDNIMDTLNSGDFDLALYSNITSSTGDAYAYLNNTFKSNGSSNYGYYSNSEVDSLLNGMGTEFNKDIRNELARKIQEMVIQDEAYNFIAYMKLSFVMKSNVVGIKPHATDYYQFTVDTDIE